MSARFEDEPRTPDRTIITFDVVYSPCRYDGGWSWNVRKHSEKGTEFAGGSIVDTKWGMRFRVSRFIRKQIRKEMKNQ